MPFIVRLVSKGVTSIEEYAFQGNYENYENSDHVTLTICQVSCTEEHEKDDYS